MRELVLLARRLGVLAETVAGWRQDALAGMKESLRRGTGKTPRELELEREVDKLRRVVTTTAIEKCLLEQALDSPIDDVGDTAPGHGTLTSRR